MINNRKNILLYQKTDFNHNLITQLSNIYKCCKCKRNNSIIDSTILSHNCLFCNTPNYINREKK
jgi:hypothetical protein